MSAKQIVGEWTPWSGAPEAPLPDDTQVLVQYRDGDIDEGTVDTWFWEHLGSKGDIVAYAVITSYVAPAWRAERGREFFYVTTKGRAMRWTEKEDDFCNKVYEAGNYYQTEDLATDAAQRVLNAYKGGTQ